MFGDSWERREEGEVYGSGGLNGLRNYPFPWGRLEGPHL